MSNYGKAMAQHLSNELGVDIDDVIAALDSFTIGDSSKEHKEEKKSTVSKKSTTSSKKTDEKQATVCCRIKKGQTEPCGAPAKNNFEGKWYCGTEKGKCYSMVLKAKAENELNSEAGKKSGKKSITATTSGKVKVGKASDRKSIADSSSESLIAKIVPKKKLMAKEFKTKTIGTIYYDIESRYLIDKDTKEIYGILGKDNDSVVPLTDEQIRLLEGSNHFVRANKKADHATVESENSEDELSSVTEEEKTSASENASADSASALSDTDDS